LEELEIKGNGLDMQNKSGLRWPYYGMGDDETE